MKIGFENLPEKYLAGMKDFLAFHGFEQGKGGISVKLTARDEAGMKITKAGDEIEFALDDFRRVFRALTLVKPHLREEEYAYEETRYFDVNGMMFDGSQASSLMNVASVKKMLLIMAGMGYNELMLYCEDCYEVPGEPYWGWMRPRFSCGDFKALDDYAFALGIELVPCIQSLGHLTEAIKRPVYNAIADTSSVLMVGDERVYALLDKIMGTMASCFRSRRIHLGLDEAWDLGLGKYLRQNGYHPQDELMMKHINRVYQIADKYGFRPMMWADMFFRARSKTGGYYDLDVDFDEKDRADVPDGMRLIYWDYYHEDRETYQAMIEKYAKLVDPATLVFAGCSRNVRTFGSHHRLSETTTDAALTVCKQKGIRDVFSTVWGDDHRESSTFAVLPAMQHFAEHMYHEMPDAADVRQRFESCTNVPWEAFMDINSLDDVPGFGSGKPNNLSPTRAILWQDIMMGIMEGDLGGFDFAPHMTKTAEKLRQDAEKYPVFADVFTFYAALADALALKNRVQREIYDAYHAKDKETLTRLKDRDLPELYRRLQALRVAHRTHYMTEYKPIGWETLDIRYGGAIMRADTAAARLADYLDGRVDRLEELEEPHLSFSGNGSLRGGINYLEVCSASRI